MQGMRDLLRGSLSQSLAALTPADRLAAAWPVACGRAMAAHGEIVDYAAGVVHVQLSERSWLDQMTAMRSALQHDLARVAGVPVTGIHFHLEHASWKGSQTVR